MKAAVLLEHRFTAVGDDVFTAAPFHYGFWQRYLEVFDEVRVIARVRRQHAVPHGWHKVNGSGVEIWPLPNYNGALGYWRQRRLLDQRCREAVAIPAAVILRVPSIVSGLVTPGFVRSGRPFAVEVLGDPADVFGRHAFRHPLRLVIREILRRRLLFECRNAAAAAYVTERTLQARYPSRCEMDAVVDAPMGAMNRTVLTSFSSIQLPAAALVSAPDARRSPHRFTIAFVGSLAHPYKGVDVLLKAVARCRRSGMAIHLRIIGDGAERPRLERLACRLRVDDCVEFVGRVPSGEAVWRELDKANLFVLPSRAEGLPRALIEAMARGRPCLATDVGGNPELLDAEDLVKPGDVNGLAEAISAVATSDERIRRMSARNLMRALRYTEDAVAPRRRDFYATVNNVTRVWYARHAGVCAG